MLLAISFCSFPWWLAWLLPFLLGLLLGWLLWGKYKGKMETLNASNKKLQGQVKRLEEELGVSHTSKTALESEIALLKGRIREQRYAAPPPPTAPSTNTGSTNTGFAATSIETKIDEGASITSDTIEDTASKIEDVREDLSSSSSNISQLADTAGETLNPDVDITSGDISTGDITNTNINTLTDSTPDVEDVTSDISSATDEISSTVSDATSAAPDATSDPTSSIDDLANVDSDIDGTLENDSSTAGTDVESTATSGDSDETGNPETSSRDLQSAVTAGLGSAVGLGGTATGAGSETLGIAGKDAAGVDPSANRKAKAFGALKEGNLQVIEGIGPKMNEVLNDAGVNNWTDLAAKTPTELRAILDAANAKRYRIIDPSSWAQQAALARTGKWEELITLQKNLDSGRAEGAVGETDSKVEKLLIKMGVLKKWKKDDLTAVEGIGPKISGLLKDEGIDTWRKLANTQVSTIQSILDAAGKRYKLADPSTWPKQAEMAADGRWDDLDEYQDFLQAGK